ncbi:MAG: hypothetical protein K9M57_00825 [Phycisphaerae bacterium]|nr:hypothetical protein [Phycisphaerae bacterium]
MNPAENNIERHVKEISFKTRDDLDAQILSDALAALDHSNAPPGPDEPIRRMNMKSYMPLLVTAAAVIAIIVGIVQFNPDPKVSSKDPIAANKPDIADSSTTDSLVPLEIEFPQAMFVGTPANLSSIPNLEPIKPEGDLRPPIMVPKGTKNVARNKQVSASDEDPIIGSMGMINDGNKQAADGSYIEFAPGPQHVTLDLGEQHNIYAIAVWHYHKTQRVYFDVIVQTADDPDFLTHAKTLFNNDIDNSSGMGVGTDKNYIEDNKGKLINARGTRGRYVRLYSNGNNLNNLNHLIEIEVYGQPVAK